MDLARLFALWDAAEPAPGRTARMLAAAGEAEPGALGLGEAARRMMALRQGLAGRRIAAIADCAACGLRHDVELDMAMLEGGATSGPLVVERGGWRALVRVPCLDDVAAASRCGSVEEGASVLAARSIITLEGPAGEAPPPAMLQAIEEALDAAEPLADARIAMTCTACGAEWEVGFDPAGFLAAEIAGIGQQHLAEVATLARAYGWSESAILEMPPARRRAYRALAG